MHRIVPCVPYLPRRASDTNKYDYGRVLIIGGCVGYTGAPTLCARAALRCGIRRRAGGNLHRYRRKKRRGDAVPAAICGGKAGA